jgi:hypothetical protein
VCCLFVTLVTFAICHVILLCGILFFSFETVKFSGFQMNRKQLQS